MKIVRFFILFSLLFFVASATMLSSDVVEEATKAFMDDNPREAVPLLEAAVQQDPDNEKLYLYLGIAHEQLQEWESAAETYQKGLEIAGDRTTFLFNLGNNYTRMGEYEKAMDAYTRAIETGGETPPAYLNRANLRVRMEEYQAAVADYRIYLSLRPNTPQRESIERMISLLTDKLRAAEAQRREEERRKKEEERRRKELLDQVLSSLEESSEETKNLQAGTGDVKEYEEDFDIVD